jgi:uncharacterized membrane protein YdcZ (DUF606 family)
VGYLAGVTSAIQTQINSKQASITGAATSITSNNLTASKALVSDTNGKIVASSVTSTELGYLSGVTSAIQTQLNSKLSAANGAVSTVVSTNLTASKALVSDTNGKIAASAVTSTELGYLSGVTSGIQGQLNGKLSTGGGTATGDIIASSFYAGNWFRSTGKSGWYNQDYGGGVYMEDSFWVRTWAGKGFAASGGLAADRLQGYYNSNSFYLGPGSCRVDTTENTLRLYTSAIGANDYGFRIDGAGGWSCLVNNSVVASVGSNGALYAGSKSAITETVDYGTVLTYCDESPNHVFNDRGRGVLNADGSCIVMLDPIYLETVNTSNSNYIILLTGIKTSNVYIDDIQSDYFIVKGEPNKEFFWQVTAERFGWENLRWNDADVSI